MDCGCRIHLYVGDCEDTVISDVKHSFVSETLSDLTRPSFIMISILLVPKRGSWGTLPSDYVV